MICDATTFGLLFFSMSGMGRHTVPPYTPPWKWVIPPPARGEDSTARCRSRQLDRIVRRPDHLFPRDLARHVGVAPTGSDSATLLSLRDALRARRKARIVYRKAGAEEGTERVVRPYALLPANDTWYLVAHCESSGGIRFFRLDRVESVDVLESGYRIPASVSVERLLASGKPFHADGAATMTVRYSPRIARWIAEREKVALAADGSLTLEHPLADAEWGMRRVLQYGADAEVIAPMELRETLVARLRQLAGS
jgi:predicted DNA-binding transcriptional regulator YafY